MVAEKVDVAQRFVRDLNELRQRAGRPSYSTLERLSEHKLRRATMSDVLNGNRVNLPDWRFVALFVAACRNAAQESGLDATDLGTVAGWKRHWDTASGGVIDVRFPGHGDQPSAIGSATGTAAEGVVRAGPPIWGSVPPRLPDFTGREAWLQRLRQALTTDDQTGVVAIQGLLGVGKTQLAIEYAHRYAHEYDLVWWVPCGTAESAHSAMADLAARLGLAEVSRVPGESDFTELFDVLRRGQQYPRWLLVVDNANELEEARSLIPPTSGHVLVTTRNSRWEASGSMVELDVFDRGESVEFLCRQIRRFGTTAAHQLAEGVGDLPLLLAHAIESHVAVDVYLARLARDPLGLLEYHPADYHASIASEWQTVLDRLRGASPEAFALLCRLAFYGSDLVPRGSLERGSFLEGVSIHALLRDPLRRVGAIKALRRLGLLQVEPGTGNFAIHQVTRHIVRNMVASSGAAEEERARHDIHLLLAAADPLTPDDPTTWQGYDELRRHAGACDISGCSHPMVRKFVVNLVRSLHAAGDSRAALDAADETLARWEGDGLDRSGNAAESHMAMRLARADALFAERRHAEAFQLRQEVLAAMRAAPDRWATEIICLESTVGLRLRMAGRFAEAQAADLESVRMHAEEFGNDDPRTFFAVSSLIADLLLAGAAAEATRLAADACGNSVAFYSGDSHPAVLTDRDILGRCFWLSGKHDEAVSLLAEVHAAYGQLAQSGTLGEDHPWRLSHELDYAIARRDKGLLPAHGQALADDLYHLRRRCWRVLGAEHPQTLAATVVQASIVWRLGGREGEAEGLLVDAERRYRAALPDHPYADACAGYLAAVRCHFADGSPQQAERLVPAIAGVTERLADSVGETHPLSLTAVSWLANALARTGDLDAALGYGNKALAGFQALFPAAHPYPLACAANVATIQSKLGQESPPGELRARYAAAIGSSHPDLALFTQGKLIDIDFTPLPL